MHCKRKLCRERMPILPVYALWPPIKTSSRFGKTPTRTSRSSIRPKPNTRNCSDPFANGYNNPATHDCVGWCLPEIRHGPILDCGRGIRQQSKSRCINRLKKYPSIRLRTEGRRIGPFHTALSQKHWGFGGFAPFSVGPL